MWRPSRNTTPCVSTPQTWQNLPMHCRHSTRLCSFITEKIVLGEVSHHIKLDPLMIQWSGLARRKLKKLRSQRKTEISCLYMSGVYPQYFGNLWQIFEEGCGNRGDICDKYADQDKWSQTKTLEIALAKTEFWILIILPRVFHRFLANVCQSLSQFQWQTVRYEHAEVVRKVETYDELHFFCVCNDRKAISITIIRRVSGVKNADKPQLYW